MWIQSSRVSSTKPASRMTASPLYMTNDNRIVHFPSDTPIAFVKFLDPSIKQLKAIENMYELQFEGLDSISRSESIYILRKATKITVDKYSKLAQDKDRTDKKKAL